MIRVGSLGDSKKKSTLSLRNDHTFPYQVRFLSNMLTRCIRMSLFLKQLPYLSSSLISSALANSRLKSSQGGNQAGRL